MKREREIVVEMERVIKREGDGDREAEGDGY